LTFEHTFRMQLVHEPSLSALPADTSTCSRCGSGGRFLGPRARDRPSCDAAPGGTASRTTPSLPPSGAASTSSRARVAYHLLRTRDVVNLGQADRGWNFAFVGAERSVRVGREADALTRAHLFSWARRFREFTIWLDDTRSFHHDTMDQLVARRPGTGIAIRFFKAARCLRTTCGRFATLPPCERVGRDWVDLKANVDLARKSTLMAGLLPRHGLDKWAEHIFVTLHATAWPFPFPDPHY